MAQPQREERGLVKYQARDGSDITLSFDTVRRYLVQGDRDKVTEQEIMYFLGICKARGLNPFKKDCYFIKYGGDPAAIVTSIDYFRSRAKAQKDCKGWQAGVIVRKKDGSLRDSEGIVLEDEQLVGGWFEAKPAGWDVPRRLEVNLRGYIKKTREGKITRFWQEENQPTMIAKVAEGQGLRMCWPDEFEKLYTEEEVSAEQPPIDIIPESKENFKASDLETQFNAALPKDIDQEKLGEFMKLIADREKVEIDEVKVNAVNRMELFLSSFQRWMAAPEGGQPGGETADPAIKDNALYKVGTESVTWPPPVPGEALYVDGDGFGIAVREDRGKWSAFRFKGAEGWRKVKGLAICDTQELAFTKLQEMASRCKWTSAPKPPWEEEKTSPEPGEPPSDLATKEARLRASIARKGMESVFDAWLDYKKQATPDFDKESRLMELADLGPEEIETFIKDLSAWHLKREGKFFPENR